MPWRLSSRNFQHVSLLERLPGRNSGLRWQHTWHPNTPTDREFRHDPLVTVLHVVEEALPVRVIPRRGPRLVTQQVSSETVPTLRTVPAILPGSKWSVLLTRIVMQDDIKVLEVFADLKIRVSVDDTEFHTWGISMELVEEVPLVFLRLKHEVSKVNHDVSNG